MECPSAHPIMRAAPRHPVLTFCPSTFSAACPGRGRTLFVLLTVLSAALRSVFAASQNPPHPHHGRKRAVFVFAGFLLLTGGTARAQGTVATDRAALVALYNATGGANWTNNTNWLSSEGLSEWHGVDTDATGRVTELHLSGNELSEALPAELGDLTNLQILDLCSNELSGEIPAELGDLTNLQILELYDTGLSGEIPAELGNLTNLQILHLYDNELSGTIPAELGNLTNLQILHLYINELSGEIPAELGNLTSLQELYLWGNELSGEIPAELGDLTNLQELHLWGNELSGTIPAELGSLTNLQKLELHDNELSGTIPAELGNLTSLQELYLWGNELSGEIPAELGDLTNLAGLYLNQNGLSGTIPAELGNLTSLQILYLWGNGLRGTIPTELGSLTNLQRLYLYDNELSGAIPAELGALTSLQILYLWGNELSGTIPTELGSLTNLQGLGLSRNGLSGTIPVELGALTNLQRLYLYGNELSGTIPAGLGSLTNLQELYLNQNELSGPLPLTLSALSQLSVLDIRSTTLCAPLDTAFQVWLATINFQGAVCIAPPPPPPPPGPGGGGGGGGGPRQTVPDVPTNLLADGGNEQVALSWEAPEDDGGFAITDYEYRINGRGRWISIDSTHTAHTVTGLDNGTAYVFQVRAVNPAGSSPYSNRAEATPGVGALDFAHFANGAGIISDLVFVNVATHPIRPVLYFYGQEGQPIDPESVVDLTGDLEVTEDGALSIQTEMEPLGELTISTHGRGEVVSGSVQVVSDGPIGGVLRFDLPGIGVAGVGASQPVKDALFPARRQTGGISTAAAIRNLGEEALVVGCQLMSGGAVLEEAEIPLEANGQEARYIEELFPLADTSDFVGSVRCTAPGLFTGIAVELDDGNRIFTTLPVVPVARTGGAGQEAGLSFAHFANGEGITSDLVFVNVETQPSGPAPTPYHVAIPPIRPALYFYDKEGNPIAAESVVDVTGDLEVRADGGLSVQTEMEPLGELTIATHGQGELVSGSVRVVSDGPIGGVLRFGLPGIGVAGVGASQPVRDAIFPARRQTGGISTAAAIHNMEEEAMVVSCRLMSGGVVLEEMEISLAAYGQEARYIEEMFTGTDTSDFVGSVRCTAPPGEGMFTGIAVELDASNQIFTTLPVVPVQR